MKELPVILAAALLIAACGTNDTSFYSCQSNWYETNEEINDNFADVFYIASVDVWDSKDADGNPSNRAVLTEEERAAIAKEYRYIHRAIFADSLNFFAPYYHQLTMAAFENQTDDFQDDMAATQQECLDAFNYYMENMNGGRPFIIAGFSQGGMMVKHLLKNMTDEQHGRMIAAYVIGEEVTAEDLKCPHIIPATCATDTGVTISFNSVCTVNDIWPLICSAPAICINPVNWCTDSTPAPFQSGDYSLTASVNTEYNVVVVDGFGGKAPKANFEEPWPEGNLHHHEILIYAPSLRRNALDRAY